MGILDNPFHITFSKSTIPNAVKKEAMFTLTNLGRQQADQLEGDDEDFSVLATMTTRRAWSIEDLSKETKMSDVKVKHQLQRLGKQGMVKTIGASGD